MQIGIKNIENMLMSMVLKKKLWKDTSLKMPIFPFFVTLESTK